MRRSIVSGLIGLTLLLGAGVWWSGREQGPRLPAGNGRASPLPPPIATPAAGSRTPAKAELASAARRGVAVTPTIELGATLTEAVNERIFLHQLAADTGLLLSDDQWAALGEVTAHYRAVRLAYEAEIAQAVHAEPGLCILEVPAYAKAGQAMREMLFSDLSRHLGAWAASEVQARLGAGLNRSFGGFGAAPQTLEFHSPGAASAGGPRVDRRLWRENGTVARTETSLPVIEDPSGTVWGPLLARAGVLTATGAL
jgi:hypothetical protein